MDAHAADGHAHADIDRHVRGYMIVFATLLAHWGDWPALKEITELRQQTEKQLKL